MQEAILQNIIYITVFGSLLILCLLILWLMTEGEKRHLGKYIAYLEKELSVWRAKWQETMVEGSQSQIELASLREHYASATDTCKRTTAANEKAIEAKEKTITRLRKRLRAPKKRRG